MIPYDDGDRRTRAVGAAQRGCDVRRAEATAAVPGMRTRRAALHAVLAVAGFGGGVATGLGCATSDQVLERRRREDQLTDAGPVCTPQVTEPCYEGPRATRGRGACTMGQRTCSESGQWGDCAGAVGPGPERCNGADDDCDGIVDNGFERDGALCFFKGAQGACRTQGAWHCSESGAASSCDAPVVRPAAETCNGIDDDCDGEVDEDSIPADQLACTTGKQGVCGTGENRCVNGEVRCVQSVPQGAEICNKLDDDCDGRIDNACVSEAAARKQSTTRTPTPGE